MEFDFSPLWISLKTATAATFFAFFAGIAAAAWMKNYRGKFRGIIDGIFTLPLVLPPTVVGFLLLLLFGINSPVGQFLKQLGITVIFSWSATAIASTVVAFPLMYKTVLSSFEHIDNDLINCARTLGLSEWKIFWLIVLPLAWSGILAGTILSFARALGEFGATLMLAGSIPGRTQTMPIAIFFAAESGDLRRAFIWVLIMVAISLAVITIIHMWDESQSISRNKDIKGVNLIRGLINLVIFSQVKDISFLSTQSGNKSSNQHQSLQISEIRDSKIRDSKIIKILKIFSPQLSIKKRETIDKLNYFIEKQPIIPAHNSTASLGLRSSYITHSLNNSLNNTLPHHRPSKNVSQTATKPLSKKTNNPKKELIVNIEKNLKTFNLKVDFIADNHTLGVLGASGSGKSMTLRCIAGLAKPESGCIILNGKVLFDSKRKINLHSRERKIGFVFQNYALFPHMNVVQNIGFGLQNLPKEERILKVQQYIHMMHLEGLEYSYPHQLSGGQQQRVALARALVIEPEAILLDEPLSALDTYLRNRIEKLLKQVLFTYEGTTLFVTHKLEEAYRVSNHMMVISGGKVIADDTKENIFERSPNLAVAQITECKNISRVQIIDSHQIKAIDWDCNLYIQEPIKEVISPSIQYIGIRAHHLTFSQHPNQENTFPCYVTDISETQHRFTVYLKLNYPAKEFEVEDFDLQVEVYKEKWQKIKNRPFPWYIHLDSSRLMLMER